MITRRKWSPSDLVLWVATLTSILLAKASMRRHSACKSVDASATVWTSFGFVHCRICQDSIKPNQTLNSKLSNCPMFNVSLTQVQVFSDDLWGTDFGQTRQKRFATSPYHKPPSPRPHGFERNLHVCTQFLRYKLQSKPAVFHCLPSWRSQRATLKIRQVEAGCPSGWHQVDLLKTKFGNQT